MSFSGLTTGMVMALGQYHASNRYKAERSRDSILHLNFFDVGVEEEIWSVWDADLDVLSHPKRPSIPLFDLYSGEHSRNFIQESTFDLCCTFWRSPSHSLPFEDTRLPLLCYKQGGQLTPPAGS